MKTKLLFALTIISLIFLSCSDTEKTDLENCQVTDLRITEFNGKKFIFNNGQLESDWEIRYSDELVEIIASHPYPNGHGELIYYGYVFKKINDCLEFYYAYSIAENLWFGKESVRLINVVNVLIQDWEKDNLFSGEITEITETGNTITRNFWIEFDTTSEYDFSYSPLTSENCINLVTGYKVDVNNDGIDDIAFEKFEIPSNNTTLNEKSNSIKIVPLNNNTLLREDLIFFEAPFNSVDMREYVIQPIGPSVFQYHDHIGLLVEYEPPFDRFNMWYYGGGFFYYGANSPLTNAVDDYLVIKIEKNGAYYYGWIKMKIDFDNCQFEVLETYSNPTPNEHISVP
jgi:hypothetical protein